ncbi:hypothetical protein [Aquisphaera insulae]|uniref:hypothetical protein n=1 Tax=Aquisphaera insulae TaxID=2712864 RepID=UPI0013ECF1D8|nr:hypothetical protein [Aquisphaera insulae]
MKKLMRVPSCLALLGFCLALSGCGSSGIDEGVPANTGYVPTKMQPKDYGTGKSKPTLGSKPKAPTES